MRAADKIVASDSIKVRVSVTDVWDTLELKVPLGQTIGQLKVDALKGTGVVKESPDAYLMKFKGAEVNDANTLAELGVPNGASLIVLSRRRRPVR